MFITPRSDPWSAMQAYVGMPYVADAFDCWDLASQVLREVFCRAVALPGARPRPQGAAGQRRAIASLRDEIAVRVPDPFTGCGVMLTEGIHDGAVWHIGIAALRGDEVWLLHNSAALGSVHFQRLADMQRFGLRLEGFYAWR